MIGLSMFVSTLSRRVYSAPVFDDSRVFTLKETFDIDRYMFAGVYTRNPVNGVINHLFFNGSQHYFDTNKKASAKRSTDNGVTHGAISDIADAADGGVQAVGGGYDNSGRLHVFFDVHTSLDPGATHWLRYKYSDDDGETFSSEVNITVPSDGLNTYRVYGKMIENNGVLFQPFYKITDEGNHAQSARYVLRSTNNGATWSSVLIEPKSSLRTNETSLVGIGNTLILASRLEDSPYGWRLNKSLDNGITWTLQGETRFSDTLGGIAHPPYLDKFKVDGVDVLAFYYVDRGSKQMRVVYGKATDVIAGISGWNLNTKQVLIDFNDFDGHFISGYGQVTHLNNDLFAKGMAYVDFGWSTETHILYYDLPTTHYQSLKTQLGIV